MGGVLQGLQRPRVSSLPGTAVSSAGQEAVELAAMAGLFLDPWQQHVLKEALGERPDGKWAAMEVGLVVSRQNGKGALLEARELAGLFLLGERLIIHSAHQFDTSLEAFRRLLFLIESNPDFDRRVSRVSRSHGEEGIELRGGQRIRFRTRTKGGGRGFSAPCVIFDEAMDLPESFIAAVFPIISAQPNPQVWYTGSAVDRAVNDNGLVFSRIRSRGHKGDDPSLAFFEWSVDRQTPDDVEMATALSDQAWAVANPALGIRISPDYVGKELLALGGRGFAVERLGVGDWPSTDADETVFDLETWDLLADPDSAIQDGLVFMFDTNPTRSSTSIAAAGRRPDGLIHVEVIDRRPGTGWVVDRLVELKKKHRPRRIGTDSRGPAASLLPELEQAGVKAETFNATDYAEACGAFFDAYDNDKIRHLDQDPLNAAVRGAAQRPLGDRWAWDRKNTAVDITPLVACTLAFWSVASTRKQKPMVVFA